MGEVKMNKHIGYWIAGLILFVFVGCKLTVMTFDVPSAAETGEVLNVTLTGQSEDVEEASKYGLVLQLPTGWSVLSAEAQASLEKYELTQDSTLAGLYTVPSGYTVWAGSASESRNRNQNVTANIRILTGSFGGSELSTKTFSLKAAVAAYRSGSWEAEDPSGIYNFSGMTSEPHLEIIQVTEITDTTAPSPVLADQISATMECCADNTITLDWSAYDEAAQKDVVEYKIYRKSGIGMELLATMDAGKQKYLITPSQEGMTYQFAVTAVDEVSNESTLEGAVMTYKAECPKYTQTQLEQFDVGADGVVGLPEAIRALQIVSGQ